MKKVIVIAGCVGLVLLGLAAYVRGGIRTNATRCFVEAVKAHQAANPGKRQYLRDTPLQKIAECAESKNSFLENLFFNKAKIGDYIRISKPTVAESKKYDAPN